MLPKNPFGGAYNLGNRNFGAGIGTKNYVAAVNVPGTLGELFDIKHDDGVWDSGTVQGSATYTTATVTLDYAL